ncbi:MAG TPA: hypothetical protein VE954_37890 [Oligoflexus sp.]|uniref:hypothetical protein n=1 Tax=Oligoflexus sp. TaxID=1971216 RepID=UPI002D52DE52|nr:hypothetical protein [Oligoflexus sp.]HYX38914.1 hypothetical protein [Oligoflexus sp.]
MNLKYFGMVVLGLAALTGCGKGADANRQSVETLDVPPFPAISDNVFALQGGKSAVSYKSTMLILNPTGDVNQLAEVIRASEVTRIKAADAKTFVGNEKDFDNRYGDSGTVVTEIKKKQEELKVFLTEAQGRAVPVPLADRQKAFAGWFDEASAALALSPDDNARLQSIFANYCDAKIVEFASHPIFANMAVDGYTQRPSPNQLCENYYASRGYFQGESCTNGNYFTCMWQEGVVKSGALLTQNGVGLADLLKPIFDDKEKTEIFRKILMADETISSPYIKPASTLVKDNIYKKKVYFQTALQSGKPSIGTEQSCINLLDPAYSFICGVFARTWKSETPQASKLLVEFNSALIVVKERDDLKTMSDAIKYFGQRPTVGTPQSSNSDYYFHALAPSKTLTQPSAESLGLNQESITTINNIFLDKVFALNPDDRVIKDQKEAELSALQKDLTFHRTERDRLTADASDALRAGIRAANAGNVAFGFIAYRMTVTHTPTIMRATITFEAHNNQIFEGCYDKVNLASFPCPAGLTQLTGSETLRPATLSMNPDKGRIEFSMVLDDPEAVGLGYKPKNEASPDYFMDLKPEEIKDTTLTFELYPNRLQSSLDILTGKSLFTRGGPYLYEAGISMWEE